MTDRRDNGPKQPDWMPEPHDCPFCTIDVRICGCPTGEQIHEEHIVRGAE